MRHLTLLILLLACFSCFGQIVGVKKVQQAHSAFKEKSLIDLLYDENRLYKKRIDSLFKINDSYKVLIFTLYDQNVLYEKDRKATLELLKLKNEEIQTLTDHYMYTYGKSDDNEHLRKSMKRGKAILYAWIGLITVLIIVR